MSLDRTQIPNLIELELSVSPETKHMCLVSRINLLHFFYECQFAQLYHGAQVAIRWCWVQNYLSITVEMFVWQCLFLVDKEIGVLLAKFGIQTVFRKFFCEQYVRQTIQLVGLILELEFGKLEFRPKIQTIVAFVRNATICTLQWRFL